MSTNIFEQASRARLRFSTTKGILTVEDLWLFGLPALDELAKSLYKELKSTEEESYIPSSAKPSTSSKESTILKLKFEIVKHVIVTLAEEKEIREQAKDKAAKKAKILDLIVQKQDEALAGKSIEELTKLFEEL